MLGLGIRNAFICRSGIQAGLRMSVPSVNKSLTGSSIRACSWLSNSSCSPPPLPFRSFRNSQRNLPSLYFPLGNNIRAYATHKSQNIPEHQTFRERLRQAEMAEQNHVEQQEDWRIPESETKTPKIFAPFLYFLAVGTISFTWAAWKTVNETKTIAHDVKKGSDIFGDFTSFLSSRLSTDDKGVSEGISEAQLRSAQKHQTAVCFGWRMQWLMGWCDQLCIPKGAKDAIGSTYLTMAEWYLNLPEDKMVTVPVLACTTAVFLMLNISRTGAFGKNTFAFLRKNMMHIPASNRLHTMTTSVFSHVGIAHLVFNTFAIFSFGGAGLTAYTFLHDENGFKLHTPEATTVYHFLAFFITAGTFANVFSQIFTRILLQRATQVYGSQIAKLATGRVPGLGASGAGYAMVSAFAFAHPKDRELQIAFIPQLHAPAKDFLTTLISIETGFLILSLVRGRFVGFLGHDAHMGGALFGYLYFRYGNVFWENLKGRIYQLDQQNGNVKSPQT